MAIAGSHESARERRGTSSSMVILAAAIGNALEWFDLLIYGYFAAYLGRTFFPSGNQTVSLLATFGSFGLAYLARPLGAIVLGAYADRAGRKAAMLVSILLMTLGTFLMAVMPGYAVIGIAAPIAVLLSRLLQGFSVGGEFGSATAFLVEHGGARRGFFAAWQWAGQGANALFNSAFGVVLTTLLTADQLQAWGWRIPYVFGLLIGPIGFYIRSHVEETPEFVETEKTATPFQDAVTQHWWRILLAIGAVVASTSSNYIMVYMPTFAIRQLHLAPSAGFVATLLGGFILTFGAPLVGHVSDRIGRTRIMLGACLLFLVTAYPAFYFLVSAPSLLMIVIVVGWIGILKTSYSGALPALMADIFPSQTRATGMSVSYNISVPIFGGFAPFTITWLIAASGSQLAPSFYLIGTVLLSVASLVIVRRSLGLR